MEEGRKKYFIHENKLMKEMEIDSEWAKKNMQGKREEVGKINDEHTKKTQRGL